MATESVIEQTSQGRHGHVVKNIEIPGELSPVTCSLFYPYTQNAIDNFKQHLNDYTGNTNGISNNHNGEWIRDLAHEAKGIDYFIGNRGYLLWYGSISSGSIVYFGKYDKFCQVVLRADDPKLLKYFPNYSTIKNGEKVFDFDRAFPNPHAQPCFKGDQLDRYKAMAFIMDGVWFVGITGNPPMDNGTGNPTTFTDWEFHGPDGFQGAYDDNSQYVPNSFNWHNPYDKETHTGIFARAESTEQGGDDAYRTMLDKVFSLTEDQKRDPEAVKKHKEQIEFFIGLRNAKYSIGSYISQPIFGKTLWLAVSKYHTRIAADDTAMPYFPADTKIISVQVPPSVGWYESIISKEMLVPMNQNTSEVGEFFNESVVNTRYSSSNGDGADSALPLYFEGPYGIKMVTDKWGTSLYFVETNHLVIKAIWTTEPTIEKVKKDSQGRTYLSENMLMPHTPYSYVNCNDLNVYDSFIKYHWISTTNELYNYVFNHEGKNIAFENQLVKPAKYWYWNVDSKENPYNLDFLLKHSSDHHEMGYSEDFYQRNLEFARRRASDNSNEFWKKCVDGYVPKS